MTSRRDTLRRHRTQVWRPRALAGWTVSCLLILLLLRLLPGDAVAGRTLMAVAAAGVTWELFRALMAYRERRGRESARLLRSHLQEERRVRARRARDRGRRDRQAIQQAREREARAQQAVQERMQEARSVQEVQRAAREERQRREAERLGALSDAELLAELIPRCAAQGILLDPGVPANEAAQLATLVPGTRLAAPEDVQMLDQRRQAAGARHGYLIALRGFTPEAIQSAQNRPITLVDAYLLNAQWSAATESPVVS